MRIVCDVMVDLPYGAKLLEEVKGVDVVLVGEVDEAVDAVLLDVVERGVPLAQAAAPPGGRAPGARRRRARRGGGT